MPSKYVDVQGHATHYFYVGPTTPPDVTPDFSRGKAIVFVHASGSNGHSFHYQLEGLGAHHSPIALDMPGHGRSDGVRGFDTVGEYAQFLAAFLDGLGLARAVIAGRSIGAAIALEFALRFPEKTLAVIPMAGAARFSIPADRIAQAEAVVKGRTGQQFTPAGYSARTIKENFDVIREGWQEQVKTDPRVRYYDLMACTRFDTRAELGRIDRPALVLAGQEDPIATVADAEFIAQNVPGARLAIVPDASHNLTTERPAEVNAEIEKFLNQL
jgi:pimeloyl-ACP methyl ester carboxylesterase